MNRGHVFSALIISGFMTAIRADSEIGIYESDPVDTVRASSNEQTTSTSPVGTISIDCNVAGTGVIINNITLGVTPYIKEGFLPGLYQIVLKKEGYGTFSQMIRVDAGDTVSINAQLTSLGTAGEPYSPVPEAGPVTRTFHPSQPSVGRATIKVTCSNTDSAAVVINKTYLGKTPFARSGFRPGYYEVEVKKKGFEPFSKMIHCGENSTVPVEAKLKSLYGRLVVSSTPPEANVFLNQTVMGKTPFDSGGIKPGLYQMRIELPSFVPWRSEITIEKNRTDSIGVSLMSVATHDSIVKINLRRFRMGRRIFFGTASVGLTAVGIYYNSKAARQLEEEKSAWASYNEENLTGDEYNARFESYQKKAEVTDTYMKNRNMFYLFGLISAVGFALSIPF